MNEDLKELSERMDEYYGPALLPVAVSQRYIDLGRQRGKTETLCRAIAKTKGPIVVISHTQMQGREIIKRACEINPEFDFTKVKIVSAGAVKLDTFAELDDIEEIRGFRRQQVYIDNAVWDRLLSNEIVHFYNRG